MTSSPIASPANIAAAEAALGGPILGNDLVTSMQQLVIAIANGSGGGGGGSGTVTSVSATGTGGITVNVINPTTTPAITIDGSIVTANAQVASYVLALADAGKHVTMTSGSPMDLTVPPNGTIAFPVGTQILISQLGTGQVTLVPGVGVTINSYSGALKCTGQYAGASIIKLATNTWIAQGNLTT